MFFKQVNENSRQNRGFTVIELLTVLAIMAIMAAVVLPRVTVLSRWKLESAAKGLASDLRLVRQEAITTGQVSRVVFYVFTNRYQVRLPGEDRWVNLPEGVSYEGSTTFLGNPPNVHFNKQGHPSGGGTVIFKSDQGEKRYIIVTPVTGRVRISKVPPEHW